MILITFIFNSIVRGRHIWLLLDASFKAIVGHCSLKNKNKTKKTFFFPFFKLVVILKFSDLIFGEGV